MHSINNEISPSDRYELDQGHNLLIGLFASVQAGELIMWTPFEASRYLLGLRLQKGNEEQQLSARMSIRTIRAGKYIAPHLFLINELSTRMLEQMNFAKKGSMSPQDWVAWADACRFKISPVCRELVEKWSSKFASVDDITKSISTLPETPSLPVLRQFSTKGTRSRSPMDPIITAAFDIALTKDKQGVWAAMVDMADQKDPPHPLLHSLEDGKVILIKGSKPEFTLRRLGNSKRYKEKLAQFVNSKNPVKAS